MIRQPKSSMTLARLLPYILMVAALIGLLASFVLTYDKIQSIQDPSFSPACNINPVLSCGSVMKTAQASIAGIPNSIFGLVAFSVLFTFGVMLAGGAQVKRWVWLCAQVAALIGVVFMHYLFFQGVFVINAICPWCFVVWMITIPIFWYVTVYNLQQGHLRPQAWLRPITNFIQKHHGDILVIWYMVILGILLQHFWYYWSSLL